MNHSRKLVEAIKKRQLSVDRVRELHREVQHAETVAKRATTELARQIKNVVACKPVLFDGWIYRLDENGELAIQQAEFIRLEDA